MGRNGLHRYNNQDHAMLTGMLAARNVVLGERNDLWSVNVDQDYHEEVHGAMEPDGLADAHRPSRGCSPSSTAWPSAWRSGA